MGPVSPKRIYRNLSVRLRGGESFTDGETDATKHQCRASSTVRHNKETQLSCWVCFVSDFIIFLNRSVLQSSQFQGELVVR